MSRSIIALVLMLVAASAFVLAGDAHVARAQDVTLTLSEAIEQGLVQAEFLGTGNASGAAVVLQMRRTVADPLMITVPAGTRLANAAPREQDMVVRRLLGESTGRRLFPPLTQIELRDDETYAFLLEAYCLEAHRDNPSDDAIFNYDGTADATVVAVLNAVDE